MSIFDEGMAQAERWRQEKSPDDVAMAEARGIIAQINSQLPDLYGKLTALRVAPTRPVVQRDIKKRTWFDRLVEASPSVSTRPYASGWVIFTLTHHAPDQVGSRSPAGPGTTIERSLVLLTDGRVVETDGPAFMRIYKADLDGNPPGFIYPTVDKIKYSQELQTSTSLNASGGAREQIGFCLGFAHLYRSQIVDFVASTFG